MCFLKLLKELEVIGDMEEAEAEFAATVEELEPHWAERYEEDYLQD